MRMRPFLTPNVCFCLDRFSELAGRPHHDTVLFCISSSKINRKGTPFALRASLLTADDPASLQRVLHIAVLHHLSVEPDAQLDLATGVHLLGHALSRSLSCLLNPLLYFGSCGLRSKLLAKRNLPARTNTCILETVNKSSSPL